MEAAGNHAGAMEKFSVYIPEDINSVEVASGVFKAALVLTNGRKT